MKQFIKIIFLILTILACQPTDKVKFEFPQPESEKPLTQFNKSIQGVYFNFLNPSKELIINDNSIITKQTFAFSCKRTELEIDSSEYIDINNNQDLINYLIQDGGSAFIKNDSIFYHQVIIDTTFAINNENLLKKSLRNYFLNCKDYNDYWSVRKIETNKDTLFIGEITPSDTLLRFDFVRKEEKTRKDSSIVKEYILNPMKKDLKQMIRMNTFDKIEKYIKK